MVSGRLLEDVDKEPIAVDGGEICSVKEFPYLGSMITISGRMDTDLERKIANGSKAFKALKKVIFLDKDFTLTIKKKIHLAWHRVLEPSLETSEEINTGHHICIRIVMGIPNQQKWSDCITMAEIRRRWGSIRLLPIRSRSTGWNGWDTLHVLQIIGHLRPLV